MPDRSDSELLAAAQVLLDRAGIPVTLIPERTAAHMATLVSDYVTEARRAGQVGPGLTELAKGAELLDAARKRREDRAQVPQVPQPSVPPAELTRRSSGVGHNHTTEDAAARLGISPRAVRKAIAEGRLKATQVAGQWVIAHEDLIDFEEARSGRTHRKHTERGI